MARVTLTNFSAALTGSMRSSRIELDEIGSIRDRFAFARKLRAQKFDLWFDLTLDRAGFARMLRDMIFARLLGVRWAFGWRLEHLGFAAKAEAEVKVFPDEVERLAEVLRDCGIETDITSFPPFVDEPPDNAMCDLLIELRVDEQPMVAIAPGARRSCNLWPVDRFEAVAQVPHSEWREGRSDRQRR